MDPRLIELNPRIDEAAPGPLTSARHAAARPAADRSGQRWLMASLTGTRKHVGRWLVGIGTALEGGPARQAAGTVRR